MARTRRGSTVKKGLKFFIYGVHGTWKSSFCLDTMKMTNEDGKPLKVAYIDTEGGSIDNFLEDLEKEGIDLNNLFIIYTSSYNETIEWSEKVINNEDLFLQNDEGEDTEELVLDADGNKFIADVIVIDSATVLQDTQKFSKLKTSEIRARLRAKNKKQSATEQFVAEATAGLESKDYQKIGQEGKHFLQSLVTKTDKYIIVTSRQKDDTENVPNGNGGWTFVKIGEIPDCFKGAEYEFYTVLKNFEDKKNGEIKAKIMRKDRTGKFKQNEIIDAPSPIYWQSVIDSNKGKKKAVIMEDYNTTVQKEFEKDNKSYKNVLKENEKNKTTNDNDNDNDKNEDKEDNLYNQLIKLRNNMNPTQKKQLTTAFRDAKLPARPTKETDEKTLQEMFTITEKI